MVERVIKYLLFILLWFYRTIGTTYVGGNCRFYPSCSEYALNALKDKNAGAAILLIFKRLMRCRPFSPHGGFDPVPHTKKGCYHE